MRNNLIIVILFVCLCFFGCAVTPAQPPPPTILFHAKRVNVQLDEIKFEVTMPPKESNIPAYLSEILKWGIAGDVFKALYGKEAIQSANPF